MKTSSSQVHLAAALLAAKKAFPRIAKTKRGQSGNRTFNYAPLDEINDHVDPILWEHGLMITQGTDGHSIETRLEHPASGEWREINMPVNVEHGNMQSYGIEVSYRRRYSVQLIIGIVTEEDIDIKAKERQGKDFTGKDDVPGAGSPAKLSAEAAAKVISADRKDDLERDKDRIVAAFRGLRTDELMRVVDSIEDAEERVYLNGLLGPHADIRRFIKAQLAERRKKEAVTA